MNVAHCNGIPNTASLALSPDHQIYLTQRAVDPDTAYRGHGVCTVTADEGARLLGFAGSLASAGLAIPYANAAGYVRIRVDAEGSYLVPGGREVPIYIPIGCQREGDAPLFVVEGPVKALAMLDHGFNSIALGGVATTLTSDHTLNDSWKDLALFHRDVYLVFDAGRQQNVAVARAEARLVLALEAVGAKVRVVALPLRDGGEDQGPDDYLALHDHDPAPLLALVAAAPSGDPVERAKGASNKGEALKLLEDLPFLLAVNERGAVVHEAVTDALAVHKVSRKLLGQAVKDALKHGKGTKPRGAAVAGYDVRDGRLCLVTSDGSTERVEPIANFHAEVVEDRTLDDGSGETSRVFVLEGALDDGSALARISVSPPEFIGDLWPTAKWGSKVIISAGVPRPAHHLMNAIKAVSNSVKTTAFSHTGFREHDGQWVFLHGGGAVGDDNVLVELTGGAAKVVLPAAAANVASAVGLSLSTLRIAEERITRPLHAAAYRAPLNEVLASDFAVVVYGKTGNLKSAAVAVFQSHYGDFDHASLPINWEWTANAIETGLHRMKDVLAVIDDLVPKADPRDEIQKKADRILRSIGNGAARGRLSSDLRSRPERPCRATVIITGEDLPRGESIQARTVALQVGRGDVNQVELTQVQGGQDKLPHAMRAYIEWLQPQMPVLKTEVKKKFLEFRGQLDVAGHLRAPSAIAHLLVGVYYFAEFAKSVGVMTSAEAVAHVECTKAGLLANAQSQALATEQSNPALRFMEVLRNLYVQNKIALKPIGQALVPYNAHGAAEVGWRDETHAFVLADAALVAVNKELAAMNEAQPVRGYGLWTRMVEDRYIEPAGAEPTHKFDGEGKGVRVRVLKMGLRVLQGTGGDDLDPDDGPGGGEDEDEEWPAPDDDGVEPPDVPLDRLLRSRPANDASVRMSGSRPDLSKLPDKNAEVAEVIGTSTQNAVQGTLKSPLVRMSGSSEGRVVHERGVFTPMGGGEGRVKYRPVEDLYPGETRTSGHPDKNGFAEALRAAGRAGLAAVTGKDRRILAIAVPNGPTLVVDLATGALGPIGDALGQVTLVGHDLRSVTALLQAIGIQPTSLFDTAVAWKLYDGGRHDDDGFFSFANAWRTLFGTDLPTYPSADAQVQEQARVVLALETEFRSVLAEDGLEEVAALEFSLLPIVVEMEATGIAIDSAAWKQVTTAWKEEAEALRTTVSTTLGVKNLDDDKQVLAALQRLGIPVERTNGEALAQYNNLPVVAQLGRYRSLIGFVRSSGKAVLEALDRSPDGRVHTSIHQLGARTGRVSCSEPNLMGLPRARDIRACIGAPPGKKLVIGDYKAIEMRVIADQTGDEHLRKVFTGEEGDPHRHTASVLLKKAEENVTDEERKPAKPVNFGLSFGMSSKTLVTYARKNFKVVLTEAQAEKFKATFLDHYAGVRVWQEKTANEMLGQLRTRSGRVTYYPYSDEGFNARLSFPIQGTAADGMKAAIVLLHPRLAALGARIVLVVHDELVVEAPEEHADEVRVLMRECMIAGMQRYVPSVPIIVEPEVRSTWAE